MKDFIELTAFQEKDTTKEVKVYVQPKKIMMIVSEGDKTAIMLAPEFTLDVKETYDEINQKIYGDECKTCEPSPNDIKNKAYKEILSDEVVTTYIPVNTWRESQEKYKAYIL